MTCASALLSDAEEALQARRLGEALQLFDKAQVSGIDPDRCGSGRWLIYMLNGDFGSAWSESDLIRSRGGYDPHRFWQGEAIQGKKVILRCLHGFGDTVQFLRYVPRLQAMAAKRIIEVPPRLK